MPSAAQVAALYASASGYQTHRVRPEKNRYERWTRLRDARLARVVGPAPTSGGRLLDIGCATGTFMLEARACAWDVRGLEPGEHLVAFGRDAYRLDISAGGVEDVNDRFAPESFDVVTMWDVIEHLRDPLDAVARVLRVLRPGGRLWMATPNEDGWVSRFHWSVVRPLWGLWPHPEPPRHLHQFSRKTIGELYRRAGLLKTSFVPDEIPLWYTAGFAGVPGAGEWVKGERDAYRALYVASLPVFLAARAAGRGDSMIVCGVRE